MTIPLTPAQRALFNPTYVTFSDGPTSLNVVEPEPSGAVTVDFAVAAPSIRLRAPNKNNLYWLRNQCCADAAILIWCGDDIHLHLIELKKSIGAQKWNEIKVQFAGMLANVDAMIGTMRLPRPVHVTCHVAFQNDNFAASPILTKVINTPAGAIPLGGAEWAAGKVDLPDWPQVAINKIVWGSGPTPIGCP